MKIGKQIIKIGSVGQNVNNAETANYFNAPKNGCAEVKNQTDSQQAEPCNNPMDSREIPPIREQIMLYVSCLIGQVSEQWISRYDKLWEGILDLDIVAAQIYDRGKQKGTAFNRNMVANIIHFLGNRKELDDCVYKDYNASKYAEKLERDKDHSVRAALRQDPDEAVTKRLVSYIETFKL